MGINDDILSEVAEMMEFMYSSVIGFEDFQIYYFEVFSQVQAIIQGN